MMEEPRRSREKSIDVTLSEIALRREKRSKFNNVMKHSTEVPKLPENDMPSELPMAALSTGSRGSQENKVNELPRKVLLAPTTPGDSKKGGWFKSKKSSNEKKPLRSAYSTPQYSPQLPEQTLSMQEENRTSKRRSSQNSIMTVPGENSTVLDANGRRRSRTSDVMLAPPNRVSFADNKGEETSAMGDMAADATPGTTTVIMNENAPGTAASAVSGPSINQTKYAWRAKASKLTDLVGDDGDDGDKRRSKEDNKSNQNGADGDLTDLSKRWLSLGQRAGDDEQQPDANATQQNKGPDILEIFKLNRNNFNEHTRELIERYKSQVYSALTSIRGHEAKPTQCDMIADDEGLKLLHGELQRLQQEKHHIDNALKHTTVELKKLKRHIHLTNPNSEQRADIGWFRPIFNVFAESGRLAHRTWIRHGSLLKQKIHERQEVVTDRYNNTLALRKDRVARDRQRIGLLQQQPTVDVDKSKMKIAQEEKEERRKRIARQAAIRQMYDSQT